MSSTARIPAAEITGVYGALVKMFSRRIFGKVPDSMAYMWHNTRVLKDMMSLGQKIEKWDRLDPDLASYATIASAAYIGCSFCVDLNYFKAHHGGLELQPHGIVGEHDELVRLDRLGPRALTTVAPVFTQPDAAKTVEMRRVDQCKGDVAFGRVLTERPSVLLDTPRCRVEQAGQALLDLLRDGSRMVQPGDAQIEFDARKPDGTPRKLLDVSRMKALGWSARIDLHSGIRSAYEDLRRSLQ